MPIAIDKPSKYFNTKLYTGNSNATQTISGVGFQPDFSWLKCRDSAEYHHLADAVRGANKFLHSNNTNAERTGSYDGGSNTMAFTSDGFSLTNPTATDDELNFGSRLYCSWNWKANGAGSSNTAGTLTATVSANTTSGFSICKITEASSYSGTQTFGHGLGVAPSMVIYRMSNTGSNWQVYHKATGTGITQLNNTNAVNTSASYFPAVSSTTVSVGEGIQGPTYTSIAYCFAEVKGFSKAFSYTGNGSSDGTFVYCGFKPAFIMTKNTSQAASWFVYDNKRNTYNSANTVLAPNASDTEADWNTTRPLDILSNGFKLRVDSLYTNTSGNNYIGIAFAENPFCSSKGIPTTAR